MYKVLLRPIMYFEHKLTHIPWAETSSRVLEGAEKISWTKFSNDLIFSKNFHFDLFLVIHRILSLVPISTINLILRNICEPFLAEKSLFQNRTEQNIPS